MNPWVEVEVEICNSFKICLSAQIGQGWKRATGLSVHYSHIVSNSWLALHSEIHPGSPLSKPKVHGDVNSI